MMVQSLEAVPIWYSVHRPREPSQGGQEPAGISGTSVGAETRQLENDIPTWLEVVAWDSNTHNDSYGGNEHLEG